MDDSEEIKRLYPKAHFERISGDKNKHDVKFRLAYKTKEEFVKWLEEYKQLSGVTFRVHTTTKCTKKKVVYKAHYRCKHNTCPSSHRVKMPSNKHTGCEAKLKVSIQSIPEEGHNYSKDVLRTVYPTIIEIHHYHNHGIGTAEELKYNDVSEECKRKFLDLFRSHHDVRRAFEIHQQDLMEEHEDNYFIAAADRSICPDIQWVYRLYNSTFIKEFGGKGDDLLGSLKTAVDASQSVAKMEIVENNFVVAICTPIMQRVHSLPIASHIVFVDSSGNMDRYNCRVFLLMTDSSIGGLPLGILMSSSESEKLITIGLRLLKELFPTNAFGGMGSPQIFLTDNCLALQNSLEANFPNTKIWLCSFHILQATWRWLFDSKHMIHSTERQELFYLFKSLVVAEYDDFDELVAGFRRREIVRKNCNFLHYVESLLPSCEKWSHAYREYSRGNNTNNTVESAMNVLKDRILHRTRAYNVNQLFFYLTSSLSDFYSRKIIDMISGRYNNHIDLRYIPNRKKMQELSLSQNSDGLCSVRNNQTEKVYEVNLKLGICSCPVGMNGRPCKHQHYVAVSLDQTSVNIVPQTEDIKLFYHWVATGSRSVPENWYSALSQNSQQTVENRLITTDMVETPSSIDLTASVSETNTLEAKKSRHEDTESSENILNGFLSSFEKRLREGLQENPNEFRTAVEVMHSQLNKMKTESALVSAMHCFGKSHLLPFKRSTTIPVQPTSIDRRNIKLSTRKCAPQGRPVGGKGKDHAYSKQKGVRVHPYKAPHNLEECLARNISLGK